MPMPQGNFLPPKLAQALLYGPALLAVVFAFTYSGPYRWLAELQMEWLGGYHPFLTWMGTWLGLLFALGLPLQVPRKLGLFGTVHENEAEAAARAQVIRERSARYRQSLIVTVAGATLLFVGGRDWLRARGGKNLEQISLAALERGTAPSSTYLEINGAEAVWDGLVESKDGRSIVTYVPVLSRARTDNATVAAILKLTGVELARARGEVHAFQGATDELGLPGAVRAAFTDAGFDVANALVLHVGQVPAEGEQMAQFFVLLGGAVFLVGLGLGVRVWRDGQHAGHGA